MASLCMNCFTAWASSAFNLMETIVEECVIRFGLGCVCFWVWGVCMVFFGIEGLPGVIEHGLAVAPVNGPVSHAASVKFCEVWV